MALIFRARVHTHENVSVREDIRTHEEHGIIINSGAERRSLYSFLKGASLFLWCCDTCPTFGNVSKKTIVTLLRSKKVMPSALVRKSGHAVQAVCLKGCPSRMGADLEQPRKTGKQQAAGAGRSNGNPSRSAVLVTSLMRVASTRMGELLNLRLGQLDVWLSLAP